MYKHDAKLIFLDTDSYCFQVFCEDPYRDIKENISFFDTSDYPEDNPYGIPRANKKVLLKVKDEMNGKIIYEAVALKPKMYALKLHESGKITKRAKGIKKGVVDRFISFDDYKKCLFQNINTTACINLIQNHKHNMYTVAQTKLALDKYDNKRVFNGIYSLPYGHKDLY